MPDTFAITVIFIVLTTVVAAFVRRTSRDKYVSQMKQELMGSVGTSFEPLPEKYIGHKVVLELIKGEKVLEYCGVLKEYTAEFIEIMDVDYGTKQDEPPGKADLLVLRKYGLIRHLGE